MNWLALTCTLICIFLLLLPLLFRLLCTGLLGFKAAAIKLKHPFHFVSILFEYQHPLWGIQNLMVYVPSMKIKPDFKKFKVNILLNKPKVMLTSSYEEQLQKINMLDAGQEHKFLYNIIKILKAESYLRPRNSKKTYKNCQNSSNLLQSNANNIKNAQGNRFLLAIKAAIQFLILLLLQFIQITIQECEIGVVTPLPQINLEKEQSAKTAQLHRLMLMECCSEYLLAIPLLSIQASVHNHQLEISLGSEIVKILTARHMEDLLLNFNELDIRVLMPFTFSLDQTLKRTKIKINVRSIYGNTIPADFQDLFTFINKIKFNPGQTLSRSSHAQNEERENWGEDKFYEVSQEEEEQLQKKVIISIKSAQILMKNLPESEYDAEDTQKYLSNIQSAIIRIDNFSIKESQIRIMHSKLSIKKYQNTNIDADSATRIRQKKKTSGQVPECSMRDNNSLIHFDVVEINNLNICTEKQKNMKIQHDDVTVSCQKEQVALLGKLFRLINDRLTNQEYNPLLYQKYKATVQAYVKHSITLEECMIQMMETVANLSDQKQNEQNRAVFSSYPQETILIYAPKHLEFHMDISELEHRIDLTGSSYTQKRYINSQGMQINHELHFGRIHMQYQGIKQFHVSQFRLFYQQSLHSNQLSIFTNDIHMVQNYYTLKDYLVGFVTFKQLLQIDSNSQSQEDDQVSNPKKEKLCGKVSKKTVRLGKISLNYADEIIEITKMQVQKQVSATNKLVQLYFSLGKCAIIIAKIKHEANGQISKVQSANINKQSLHTLFSIASITIKTFPITYSVTQASSSGTLVRQKQKSMIHIKSPTLLLPQTSITFNIAERFVSYIKAFDMIQPEITGYITNKSNDKIRRIRASSRRFMQDPPSCIIKITNIMAGIEDGYLDRTVLNKMRFYREYYRFAKGYNESEILNYLKQTVKLYNLCELRISCLSLEIKPLEAVIDQSEESVKKWTGKLKAKYSQKSLPETRLIRVNNAFIAFQSKQIQFIIRDYILPLINCTGIKGSMEYIKTKDIYEEVTYYTQQEINIGDIEINTGLCLLSGIRQVHKNLVKYEHALNRYKDTGQFLDTLKNKKTLKDIKYKPYWHIMHRSAFWNIIIKKQQSISVKILTGLTPYSKKHLEIVLGPLTISSNPVQSVASIKYLSIKNDQFLIFQLQEQEFILRTSYDEPYLSFQFDVKIHSSKENKSLQQQHMNRLIISDEVIKNLSKIKQFRTDWLMIYNLIEPQSKKQEDILHHREDDQATYLGLFQMAANLQLKDRQKQLSIFSVLKNVRINCKIEDFFFELSDSQNTVEFILDNLRITLKSQAKIEEWKMHYFNLIFDTVLGRLKILKAKKIASQVAPKKFLKLFHSITEEQLKQYMHDKELFREVFFVARNLNFKLRRFGIIENKIVYIQKQATIGNIKAEVSVQLKKVLQYLSKTLLFEATDKIKKLQSKKKVFKRTPLQKFRESVILVMRINRRKKKMVQNIKLVLNIKNIQLGLKTSKRLLLITTRDEAKIIYDQKYFVQDKYHIDPRMNLGIVFKNLEAWVDHYPNHLWIFGKKYSPNSYLQASKILSSQLLSFKLQKQLNQQIPQQYLIELTGKNNQLKRHTNINTILSKGEMELDRKNLWILKEISAILVDLVDTRARKTQIWRQWKQKYSQMITHGRESIKKNIQWHFSDLSKQIQPLLQFKLLFNLNEFDIFLMQEKKQTKKQQNNSKLSPFLKLESSQIQVIIEIDQNNSSEKQFKIHNLNVINCHEKGDNNAYCNFLRMNQSEGLAVKLSLKEHQLYAFDKKILWSFIEKLGLHLNPLKIRITQEIFSSIYIFLFGQNPQETITNAQSQQEVESILPDYYLDLIINEVNVQVWYRTQSVIKRLDGVNVQLQSFQLSKQFLSKKDVFDRWTRFMIRKLASQAFSVLGQKLFG